MTPAQMQFILLQYKQPITIGEAIRLLNVAKYKYGNIFEERA